MHFRLIFRSLVDRLRGRLSRSVESLPSVSSPHSVIAPDLVIKGSVRSEGDIYLLGAIHGPIECRRIFIAPGAVFEGPICTTEKIQLPESP